MQNAFPVTTGGTFDEEVRCLIYDSNTSLIIVGGITRSNDYGPSLAPHGFLYAVDLDGNLAWGNYYNNKTNIQAFTGCSMSSDGSELVMQAKSYRQTVMMIIDSSNGDVVNFYSLENKQIDEDEDPRLDTYGAIYLDKSDYYDSKAYIYSAFTMRGQM